MYSKEEYKIVIETSDYISDVLRKLFNNTHKRSYDKYYKAIESYGLEQEHLELVQHRSINRNNKLISNDDLFVKSDKRNCLVRKRIIKQNIIPYKCSIVECPTHILGGLWLGQQLTFELDHIDGDSTNNELSNLRFLCPHCHSQTKSFRNKGNHRRPKRKWFCLDCGNKVHSRNTKYCVNCYLSHKDTSSKRKFEVSKEELEKLISEVPMTKIGEMFGVSDNAVRKRAKKLGIVLENRLGYWSKQQALSL
jgi:Zn finger protein HypA/HybF involved in hydrogenase expression